MYCINCGAEIKEDVSFCAKCGAKAVFEETAPEYAPPPPPVQPPPIQQQGYVSPPVQPEAMQQQPVQPEAMQQQPVQPPPIQQQDYVPPPAQQQGYTPPPPQQQGYAQQQPAQKPAEPLNLKLIIIVAAIAAAAVIIVVGGFMGWGPIKFGEAGTPSPGAEATDFDEDDEDFVLDQDEGLSGMPDAGFPNTDENDFYSAEDDIYIEYDEMYWPWEQDLILAWPEYADSIKWFNIEKIRKDSDFGGHGLGSGITVNSDVKGHLNVRAMPSTEADIVGKLMPGEDAGVAHEAYQTTDRLFLGTYYVVNDGFTWIYIQMWDDYNTHGWVATQYISEFGY